MTANEDFLFAQEAIAQGFVTEAQVEEGMLLQRRMAEDLKLDERLGVILVKRGYLAEDQARRVHARIEPEKAGEIRGYKLLDVVGRGAMGTVYRALHLGLNREVAIKVLRPDLVGDRTQVERLKAEAGMLASLDHPNVIRALDAGESNGFPFVVMEYVEGETLRDRLRREGPLPEAEALRITRGIADALERARRMGIVHRDVKPGNILLARNGTPKLMDLGLAKGPIDLGLTQHGATVGTPQYISPEQAVDPKKADTRSDIYSLGATLYAMLAGRPPFDGQTLAEILTKVLYETPLPVRTIRPEVSPEAGYLVERMMLRDPILRYRTPALVVEDIDRLSQGTSILPTGFSGNWEAYLVRKRARRFLVVGGMTIAAAIVVAFGARAYRGWERLQQERTTFTERVGRLLQKTGFGPSDDAASIEWKRDEVKSLEEALPADADVSNRWELRRRLADLDQAAEHFLRLDTLRRTRVEPAVSAGLFADAAQALEKFSQEGVRGYPPVEIAIARLRARIRDASDEALDEAKAAAWSTRDPVAFADVVRGTELWRDALETRFAETEKWKKARRDADDAVVAASTVHRVLVQGLGEVTGAAARELVEARQFDELRKRHGERLNGSLDAMDKRMEHLKERFGEARLKSLVRAPFDEAWKESQALVGDVLREVEREADQQTAQQQYGDAIDALQAFETATASSFPEASLGARERRMALLTQYDRARTEADARWDALLEAVVADLPVGGAAAARQRIEEARGSASLKSVQKRFDGLAKEIEAYEAFWGRVVHGLESHVGDAPAKWLDTVHLAGDAATYYKWEIRSVDPTAMSFTFVSHQGGGVRPVELRAIRDLAAEQLLSLAGLTSDVLPANAEMLAMFRLASVPDERAEPNFYVRLPLREDVVDLFDRAGDKEGPLARRARLALEVLKKEIAAVEDLARESLKTATRRMAEGNGSESLFHYEALLQPPRAFTHAVRDAMAEILAALRDLNAVLVKEQLARILPGVRVTHRGKEQFDVDLLFDMNTVEQGANFVRGLARFIPAPEPGGVTPGTGGMNMVLRLVPDAGDRLVVDRPLAWPNMFSSDNEISIAFDLSFRSPLPFPFFLGLDLGGAQVGVLSADPIRFRFPTDVPWQPAKEKKAPDFDFYGRGRGVMFRPATRADLADRDGTGFGDPTRWKWDDAYQGRHFVGKERDAREKKPGAPLAHQFFAFEGLHDHPYRVKFSRYGETLRLEVDGQTVYEETKPEFATAARSGLLQILAYTTCDIDNVVLSGRVDRTWLEQESKKHPTPGK